MKRYEEDDLCTMHFVVDKHDSSVQSRYIVGWTDQKELAKMYIEFHKCKSYTIKTVNDYFHNILPILEENHNDEISLYNLKVYAGPDHKKGKELKIIAAPMTYTEYTMVEGETADFLASRIDYSIINDYMYYLEDKWLDALKGMFLHHIVDHVVNNKQTRFAAEVMMDELLVLYHSYQDHFGI